MKRNTFCIKFYCRKCNARKDGLAPVEISVIVSGDRQMWQLPKKCLPEEFDNNLDIQLYCTAVKNKINEIYTNLTINDEPVTAFIIKDIFFNGNDRKSYTIAQLFKDGLELKAKSNIDLNTYRKYNAIIELFYTATGLNPNQEANTITYTDIMAYKAYVEKIHKPQTNVKELQRLKYYFITAFNSGKIRQNPFNNIKIKKTAEDKPFLTYEEVKTISNLTITNDRLDKVRDVFLFMCFTGLEYADMKNLKKEDVQTNKFQQLYIKKNRIKTGIEYISILYEDAQEIWRLYQGELPLLSDQKFNKYLKELAILANIDKNVTTLTARHTYACYLLNEKQISIDVVKKMLGHTNITQSLHYSKMLDNSVFLANKNTGMRKDTTKEDLTEIEEFNKLLGI